MSLSSRTAMVLLYSLCLSLCLSPLVVRAADVIGRIQWNDICRNYDDIRGTNAILDDGRWSGYVRRDGQFIIPDVEPGTYVLSLLSHDFVFEQVRVDVSNDEPYASVYAYVPGTPLAPAPLVSTGYPVVISARAKNAYFVEPEAFDPLSMLKSPMMMMMIATGFLVFATPYLMASLDEDSLKEVKDRQKRVMEAQNSLSNMDIGGLASLLGGESPNSPQSSKSTTQTAPAAGKGKAKSRRR